MDAILWPLKVAVAWVMVRIHDLFVLLGVKEGPSLAWVLSIVGLTIVVRIVIMPLFFHQIKAQRGQQLVQPELVALRAKYKGKNDPESKRRLNEEVMALYKKHNTNPFSACLPLFLQMPIFFALFRVLATLPKIANGTYSGHTSIGPLTASIADDIQNSKLFGASLSESFMTSTTLQVKIVTVILIILMSVTQFFTMRQLTMKNMPSGNSKSDNPAMRTQQLMMYIMPAIFAITGVNFQIGVLIYWLTTNVWTAGQQFWTISRMPTPGSEAEKKLKKRRAAKRAAKGLPPEEEVAAAAAAEAYTGGQRVQPVRKNRQKKNFSGVSTTPEEQWAASHENASVSENMSSPEDDNDEAVPSGGLSQEEIARRRYEKRARERQQAAARRKQNNKKRRG